jgi:hypothetical protein
VIWSVGVRFVCSQSATSSQILTVPRNVSMMNFIYHSSSILEFMRIMISSIFHYETCWFVCWKRLELSPIYTPSNPVRAWRRDCLPPSHVTLGNPPTEPQRHWPLEILRTIPLNLTRTGVILSPLYQTNLKEFSILYSY